jgi:hypothetical protein
MFLFFLPRNWFRHRSFHSHSRRGVAPHAQLIFNFITLAAILAVFVVEYWRENFLITCLDIDK